MNHVYLAQTDLNWDAILPIIVFVLWTVSRFFKKDVQDDADHRESPTDHDPDVNERARRIQEEIRRRIRERQAEQEKTPEQPQPEPVHAPHRPVATDRPTEPLPSRPVETPREPVMTQVQTPNLQTQLAQQLQLVRESAAKSHQMLRRAGIEQRQQRDRRDSTSAYNTESRMRPGLLRNELLADLASHDGMRKAILFSEILGRPVALRKDHLTAHAE